MSGLLAMMFMHFQIGFDLGRVLIKAVIFSMIVVFTLMPGLLMLFSKWIDRTHHRKFIPDIYGWGKIITKIYPLLMPIFVVAIVLRGAYFSLKYTSTTAPPASFRYSRYPPCAAANFLTMASPSPVPPVALERLLSTL